MSKKRHKYIFIIGGVMSGVGKGITSSSIGLLLQARGFSVNLVKIDPYLNVDAGTMNPTEHGEVFVLDSGLETDQDMGNYERFLGRNLGPEDYMTSGMVYQSVINGERALEYGGKCVETIPHVRDEILRRLGAAAHHNGSSISIIEIGGTVGDFQDSLFIESARVLGMQHPGDVLYIIVSYLPVPGMLGEMKTKPTQNAVRQLNACGLQPDFLIARGKHPLDKKRKEKIAIACSIPMDHVISAPDIESIYEVPLNFEKNALAEMLTKALNMRNGKKTELSMWRKFSRNILNDGRDVIDIAIVGKYFDTGDFVLSDAYLSIIEAIKFSGVACNVKPHIHWINVKQFEQGVSLNVLSRYDGVIVPGGFGKSGIEGKIKTIHYARTRGIPYFGLCYGMQLMAIEYARNIVGLSDAHTTEIDPHTPHPIITILDSQKEKILKRNYGGSMRLGGYKMIIKKKTIAFGAYKKEHTTERHRHRYEINPEYIEKLQEKGLIFSGVSPDGVLMEMAELPKSQHPFMLGTQFHPEFTARPLSPHPLFTAFLRAAIAQRKKRVNKHK